jgi:hypothetical protein
MICILRDVDGVWLFRKSSRRIKGGEMLIRREFFARYGHAPAQVVRLTESAWKAGPVDG